jgi:hypothetical protein
MDEKRQEQREGSRRVMVNTDEELIEALKEINETLDVKEAPKTKETLKVERKIIHKEGKGERKHGNKKKVS